MTRSGSVVMSGHGAGRWLLVAGASARVFAADTHKIVATSLFRTC
jgi:hypothetical protein